MIGNLIKECALKYVGQKEKKSNSGFQTLEFEEKMKAVGFLSGQAWCSYFSELVWREVYLKNRPEIIPSLKVLFNASATATFKNFDLDETYMTSTTPVVGSLVVWRHGNGWKGHIGIVVEVSGNFFKSVEGNTNKAGEREGTQVDIKQRKIDYVPKENELNLIGFILPPAI